MERHVNVLVHNPVIGPDLIQTLCMLAGRQDRITLTLSKTNENTLAKAPGADICLIYSVGAPTKSLLERLAGDRRERRLPLLIVGGHGLQSETCPGELEARLGAHYVVKHIRGVKRFWERLGNSLCAAAEEVLRERTCEQVASEEIDVAALSRQLQPGSLSAVALTLWMQAKDVERQINDRTIRACAQQPRPDEESERTTTSVPTDNARDTTTQQEGGDELATLRDIRQRYSTTAKALLATVYDTGPQGATAGRQEYRNQVTEGGCVMFRTFAGLTVMRHRPPQSAEALAAQYLHMRRHAPGFHVPGPDPLTGDYVLVPMDEGRTIMAYQFIPGPTFRELIAEGNALLSNKKTGRHLLAFVPVLHRSLREKLLKDQALFEVIMRRTESSRITDEARKLAQGYVERVIAAAMQMNVGDSTTVADALQALNPFSETGVPSMALRIDSTTLMPRLDCSISNMVLRRPAPLGHGNTDMTFLYNSAQQRVGKTSKHARADINTRDKLQKKTVNDLVDELTCHFDFSARDTVFGEDFFQMMLEPEWAWGAGMEAAMQKHLLRYAAYQVLAGLCNGDTAWNARDNRQRGAVSRGLSLLNEDSVHDRTNELVAYIGLHNGRLPSDYAYHLDWMWYYRAMRGAGITLGIFKDSMPREKADALARHYVASSLLPLERMRRRALDECEVIVSTPDTHVTNDIKSTERIVYNDPSAREYDPDQVIRAYADRIASHDRGGEATRKTNDAIDKGKMEMHVHRLEYLAAISRKFLKQQEDVHG